MVKIFRLPARSVTRSESVCATWSTWAPARDAENEPSAASGVGVQVVPSRDVSAEATP